MLVVHVAHEYCLSRTNNNTRRFEIHVDAVRAEVALLRRVVLRVDEDRIVRTRCHTRFATDADRFIKIDNAIRSLEHCSGRAGGHTRGMGALVASSYLMRAADLGKHADVNVFHVSAGHREWNEVLRLARRRTRMASDAACVVNNFRPLD